MKVRQLLRITLASITLVSCMLMLWMIVGDLSEASREEEVSVFTLLSFSYEVAQPTGSQGHRCQPLPVEAGPNLRDRCGPWFVVIGVAKGGTRQLMIDLNHCSDEVILPTPDDNAHGSFWEPKFFNGYRFDQHSWEHYMSLLGEVYVEDDGRHFTGEKSPQYYQMTDLQIGRMYNWFPRTKIILNIRDPRDRFYSFYAMQVRNGKESCPEGQGDRLPECFDRFLGKIYAGRWSIPKSGANGSHLSNAADKLSQMDGLTLDTAQPTDARHRAYAEGWDYTRVLQKWRRHYGNNVLVLPLDYLNNPYANLRGLDGLQNFLEIQNVDSEALARCITEEGNSKREKNGSYPPMSQDAHAFLTAIYKPSMEALAREEGIDYLNADY